ncbi:MAG: Holliday junction resolvase RuvX [Bacteroidota bacterium]|nr:Holliday junction resolvase RuvX [Bacteroidota bacterium]
MRGVVLAVDYGAVRIGLALSDPLGIAVRGAGTVAGGEGAVERVARFALENDVAHIVVGLPLTLKGNMGEAADRVRAFVERLRAAVHLPVDMYDERFTSSIAERTIRELGISRMKRRSKERVDEMSAVLLLQDYLRKEGNSYRRN